MSTLTRRLYNSREPEVSSRRRHAKRWMLLMISRSFSIATCRYNKGFRTKFFQ
ncbi:hypothetical protein LINPERPRIM_LOCUS21999, partial [Linum perenne]